MLPGPSLAPVLFLQIKFYWNTATSICPCIVCGSHTAVKKVSSCNRDRRLTKPTFTIRIFATWPLCKTFLLNCAITENYCILSFKIIRLYNFNLSRSRTSSLVILSFTSDLCRFLKCLVFCNMFCNMFFAFFFKS